MNTVSLSSPLNFMITSAMISEMCTKDGSACWRVRDDVREADTGESTTAKNNINTGATYCFVREVNPTGYNLL